MASIGVLLIILGCAVFQFFKGSIVRAVATIIIAVFASFVAFGFFETLAEVLIKRGNSDSMVSLVPWAQALSFLLLFVLVFAVLQTAIVQLTRMKPDLGLLPERIGRPILGIILGLVVSGNLMTCLAIAPLPSQYPYERYDPRRIQVDNPKKVLLNADGFVTGLFGVISNGSFSGKRSFAGLHPNYLDQLYLNRLDSDVSIVSGSSPAIEVPRDKAVWPASEALRTQIDELNSQGKLARVPGKPKSSDKLTIVRVGIKRNAVSAEPKINAGVFTLSQLRLICKRAGSDGNPLAGKGQNAYPIGYLTGANEIGTNFKITIRPNDFTDNSSTKNIDFVFAVPGGFTPILVEFKLNSVVQIPAGAIVTDASQAPSPVFFTQSSASEEENPRPSGTQQQNSSNRRGQGRSRSQESNGNPPRQNRAQRLTESVTGGQLDDDQ
jgi:hypothetical protein